MPTVKLTNLDEQTYAALVLRAAQHARTVSEEVVSLLRDFLGEARPVKTPQEATEAILKLAGSWEDTRTAEEIIADIRASRCSGNE
jgi:plasmid stability protein